MYNDISKYINLSVYQSIFADIIQIGHAHNRRTFKIVGYDTMFYFNSLQQAGIIEQRKLTKAEKLNLLSQEGMNTYNVNKLKAYGFTTKYKLFFKRSHIINFILGKITQISKDKIKRFLSNATAKFNQTRLKYKLKRQLQAIDINKIKSSIRFKHWEIFNISNAYDFMKLKLRAVCKCTGNNKDGLFNLESKICELVGVNVDQLRNLITSRYYSDNWDNSIIEQKEVMYKTDNRKCDDFISAYDF